MKKLYVVLLFVTQVMQASVLSLNDLKKIYVEQCTQKITRKSVNNDKISCLESVVQKQSELLASCDTFIASQKNKVNSASNKYKKMDNQLGNINQKLMYAEQLTFNPCDTTAQRMLKKYRTSSLQKQKQMNKAMPEFTNSQQIEIGLSHGHDMYQLSPYQIYWSLLDCGSEFAFPILKRQQIKALEDKKYLLVEKLIAQQNKINNDKQELAGANNIQRLCKVNYDNARDTLQYCLQLKKVQEAQIEQSKKKQEEQAIQELKNREAQLIKAANAQNEKLEDVINGISRRCMIENRHLDVWPKTAEAQAAKNQEKSEPKNGNEDKKLHGIKLQNELHFVRKKNPKDIQTVGAVASEKAAQLKKQQQEKKLKAQEAQAEKEREDAIVLDEALVQRCQIDLIQQISSNIATRREVLIQFAREDLSRAHILIDEYDKSNNYFQSDERRAEYVVALLESYVNNELPIQNSDNCGAVSTALIGDLTAKIVATRNLFAGSDLKNERPQLWTYFTEKPELLARLISRIDIFKDQCKNYDSRKKLQQQLKQAEDNYDIVACKKFADQLDASKSLIRLIAIENIINSKPNVNDIGFLDDNDIEKFSMNIQTLLQSNKNAAEKKEDFKSLAFGIVIKMNSKNTNQQEVLKGALRDNTNVNLVLVVLLKIFAGKLFKNIKGYDIVNKQRAFEYFIYEFNDSDQPCVNYALADITKIYCRLSELIAQNKNACDIDCPQELLNEEVVFNVESNTDDKEITGIKLYPNAMDPISNKVAGITLLLTNLLKSSDTVSLDALEQVYQRIDHLQHLLERTPGASSLESYFQKDLCLKKILRRRVIEMNLKYKDYQIKKEYKDYQINKESKDSVQDVEKLKFQLQMMQAIEDNDNDLAVYSLLKELERWIMGINPHAKA